MHAMLAIGNGSLPIPVSLIPLVGGVAGMFFAVLLGYVTTKKAGTPFAMITLGLGELVTAMALMIPEFFGGEGGVSANRVGRQAVARHHLRAADPGLLPARDLHVPLHRGDVSPSRERRSAGC